MTKRKPSAKLLAKSLWRASCRTELLAAKLRALGDERYAGSVEAAAKALSDAAMRTEERAHDQT